MSFISEDGGYEMYHPKTSNSAFVKSYRCKIKYWSRIADQSVFSYFSLSKTNSLIVSLPDKDLAQSRTYAIMKSYGEISKFADGTINTPTGLSSGNLVPMD